MAAEHHQPTQLNRNLHDYQNLVEAVFDFMSRPSPRSDDTFHTLALSVFAFQFEHNPPYRKFCQSLGLTTAQNLTHWTQIPAIPTDAFKNPALPITSFPVAEAEACFETSGTTSDGTQPGRHYLHSTHLYRTSITSAWQTLGLPTHAPVFLVPPPAAAPTSSLSFMMGELAQHLDTTPDAFLIDAHGHINLEALHRFRNKDAPLTLLGTALSFLHLMEKTNSATSLTLPDDSSIFETGGYKGSGRTLEKNDLYQRLEAHFAVPPERIINEYSMTELSSQFYTTALGRPHRGPHWTRARVIDPASGQEVPDGTTGILHFVDLANIHSCLAIATRDLAIRRGHEFELLGRDPQALPRGCSRSADELLSLSPPAPPTPKNR
jgi:hypothetical protein